MKEDTSTLQVQNPIDDDITQEHETSKNKGGCCGLLHRHQILAILMFAIVGIGAGIGLSYWQPDDPETKKVTIQWIGLAGDLFLRALKCFVLPLVFVNVIIAVVDMMDIGKASSIGWYVI